MTMTLTKADLGVAKSNDAPFTSHPDPDMMKSHPLEKFGCSPCHGGNGRALDSVEKGHGRYEHWLWPLYYPENFDAGCQQCHASDMVTEHAPVLNRAKQLYREKGCIGCHRFQGFDNQDEAAGQRAPAYCAAGKSKRRIIACRSRSLNKKGDTAPDNDAANRYYAASHQPDRHHVRHGRARSSNSISAPHNLLQEIKKVGPDLKEVRMKIHKEWIPYWLKHTHEFRPTTKMPQFRLQDDEIQAISAYIWQSGHHRVRSFPSRLQATQRTARYCSNRAAAWRATRSAKARTWWAEILPRICRRVGEKDNYDYLVRWILNPRNANASL